MATSSLLRTASRLSSTPSRLAAPAFTLPLLHPARCYSSAKENRDAMFDVSHVTAIVTGGASGLGLIISQALQDNGAKVYITGRRADALHRVEQLYSTGPGKIVPLHGDISKKDEVLRLAEKMERDEPNGIQLLVNNAGVARDVNTAFSVTSRPNRADPLAISNHYLRSQPEHWADTFNTNVTAGFFMSMAFLPHLARGRLGDQTSSIVNVSSVSGVSKTSSGGQYSLAASKAAFIHLTRMLATTYKETGVRVNGIAPSLTSADPQTSDQASPDDILRSKLEPNAASEGLPPMMERRGRDSDIATTILMLAGKRGNSYNDQILYPDGGIVQPTA